jgi:guanylate kinase
MKIVCIMGRRNSGKSSVKKALEAVGFKKLNTYTTKGETPEEIEELGRHGYIHINRELFKAHVERGHIIETETYDNELYGIAIPFGARKYVTTVSPDGLEKLREVYGKQVIGIYLSCDDQTAQSRDNQTNRLAKSTYLDDPDTLNKMQEVSDATIDSTQDFQKVKLDILKLVRDYKPEN